MILATALSVAPAAQAAEPGTIGVPVAVLSLAGCWRGTGDVMGKPITITLTARPILLDAMFAIDVESVARDDAADRYAAHLLFGGSDTPAPAGSQAVSGFWADSFGGAFTATGAGTTRPDGFDIIYRYPDSALVNRWRLAAGRLGWNVDARDAAGKEKPFSRNALEKVACPEAADRPGAVR